jgi:hypothetical protein
MDLGEIVERLGAGARFVAAVRQRRETLNVAVPKVLRHPETQKLPTVGGGEEL